MKRKILTIDCGNTNIKWALFTANEDSVNALKPQRPVIEQSGAFATKDINQNLSVLVARVARVASDAAIGAPLMPSPAILHVVISNVAGDTVAGALRCAFSTHAASLNFVQSSAAGLGMQNSYSEPERLGVDRFAALVAAHQQPQNQLVVMAGTALTIDALNVQGQFLGGLIVPGLRTMQDALHRGTAQLPLLEDGAGMALKEKFNNGFPIDTHTAIAYGAMQACVGAVLMQALALANFLKAKGENLDRIVIAGGAAATLIPQLEAAMPQAIVSNCGIAIIPHPNLVLEGLFYLAHAALPSA